MTLKLITAPAAEPITLAEAKLHLRVDVANDDALITSLIQAAREQAEHTTGRALITQTWERVLDAFPASEISLGKAPAQSVTSVTYINAAGDSTVVASTDYVLDSDVHIGAGFVLPAVGATWPDTRDTVNAVRVRFVAGYGASGASVPASIKSWLLLRIGTLYANRSEIAAGMTALPPDFAAGLLAPYRTSW